MTVTTTRATRMNANQVHQALYEVLTGVGYSVLEEVPLHDPTTISRWNGTAASRRIDVLALRPSADGPAGAQDSLAIEVKVSRADFVSDVKNPEKQAPWRQAANRHAFAVPAGLVSPEEVPDGSGLIYVSSRSTISAGKPIIKHDFEWIVPAPHTEAALPATFTNTLAVRAAAAEARLLGRTEPGREDDVDQLHLTIRQLRADLEKATRRGDREHDAALRWRQIASGGDYPLFCTCGAPIKVRSVGSARESWVHLFPEHDGHSAPIQPTETSSLTSPPVANPAPMKEQPR